MAGKRKDKRPTKPREDLSAPSKWRLQHGDIGAPIREADPETGTPVRHRRAVDTLGMMLANGTITHEMHEAGCIFRTLFRSAALDSMSTSQLIRLPGSTADRLSNRQLDARRRVFAAMDALGGDDSPAGSCVWFVVGLEMSVREWSARSGWSGRPVSQPFAGGILVAVLGLLAAHFGLTLSAKKHYGRTSAADPPI